MSRKFAISTALVIGLFALAAAQQPGSKKVIDPNLHKVDPPAAKQKKVDPTDAAIGAALRNDTDVRIAQAKVQLAEAELAKAKQGVVVKVLTLMATIREHMAVVEQSQERMVWVDRMVKSGQMEQRALVEERNKLEAAKAALAKAETELKLITGDEKGSLRTWLGDASPQETDRSVASGLRWLMLHQHYERSFEAQSTAASLLAAIYEKSAIKGPIPDRLRAALDKPVTLGKKGDQITFEKAMEMFKKQAGLDVPVRGTLPSRSIVNPNNPNEMLSQPLEIASEGEELPVGAWLQLFEDNAVFPQRGAPAQRFRFYVREYGLLIASATTAPADAPTLTEFWKQKASAPKESTPDPKEK